MNISRFHSRSMPAAVTLIRRPNAIEVLIRLRIIPNLEFIFARHIALPFPAMAEFHETRSEVERITRASQARQDRRIQFE